MPTTYTPCPVYRKCGGCQLQNLEYPRQLVWKQDRCQKLLGRFGKVSPILGMECPYHYRNKVQAAFAYDKRRGRIISGVYQSSTHRIVPVDSCQTEDETADRIIVSVRGLLKDFKLQAYDENTGRGFLRHVLVKRGFATGQVMVVLVTGTPVFTAKKHFVAKLRELHPEITTILQNVNDKPHLLGAGGAGEGPLRPRLHCGRRCAAAGSASRPSPFTRSTPCRQRCSTARPWSSPELTGKEKVLDAYCGIGTIGLVAATHGAGQVLGVELNPEAVRDAIQQRQGERHEKRLVHPGRRRGVPGPGRPGGGGLRTWCSWTRPGPAASGEFLTALAACAPRRVVYISCDPETLARDLGVLQANHYKIEQIQPVDMFPHTQHIECVVKLTHTK